MPAWRSNLALAKRSYLAKLLGQGMIDNFSGLWQGHFAFSMAILKRARRRGEEGGHNQSRLSRNVYSSLSSFTFLAMFLIEFIRPKSPPLSSPSRCSSLLYATCPNSS